MAQQKVTINGEDIRQPDTFNPSWETTYTEDSGRIITGSAELEPMFTVEAFDVHWSALNIEDTSKLLQLLVATPSKPNFNLHYFSPYYGEWRTAKFYVGKGSLELKTLKEDMEGYKALSCNVIGIEPIA